MILLTCAVHKELQWIGPRAEVEVLVTGVGPVDAAARVTRALTTRRYDAVVNAGIAGAMRGVASVGAGVVVGEEMMELNLETGGRIAMPDAGVVADRVPADAHLIEAIAAFGFPLVRGITVSRVTSTDTTADRLRARGAEIETMEGFAVLRAAQLAGVPAIEVRGISNIVGTREHSGWDFDAGVAGLR
ncbi:MAG: futalosine hydrolase, partial [Candidatus Eremiobacteraeota bacterium]|nr:futalosine hydrolase [Candidatus Eremiobacteraeota bacterium]